MSQKEKEFEYQVPEKIVRAIQAGAVDTEKRTVEVSFSSEALIDKGSYYEVLSHNPEDVDLSWASTGFSPVLLDHEAEVENLIGVIESVSIDTLERKGRAVVRFATDDKSEQAFIKIKDNVLVNVSVGCTVTGYSVDKESADKPIVRCKWALQELSFCALPVDKSVGVHRSEKNLDSDNKVIIESSDTVISGEVVNPEVNQDSQVTRSVTDTSLNNNKIVTDQIQIKENQKQSNNKGSKTMTIELNKEDIQRSERSRVNEIYAIADQLQAPKDVVQRAVESGQDAGAFALEVMRATAAKPVQAQIGLTNQEVKEYSLVRAVSALISGDVSKAGYEYEVSRAAAQAQGKNTNGFIIPDEVLYRAAGANATTFAENAATGLKTRGPWVEALRAKTIAGRLGITMLGGLVGGFELPRFTSLPKARQVAEGQDGTVDKVSTDLITLFPKSVISLVELTRGQMKNLPALESYIQNQMVKSISEQIDEKVFEAVLADAGIDWKVTPASGLTYADIRGLITKLNNQNVNTDAAKWAMNGDVEGYLSSTLKSDNTAALYIKGDDGRVAGLDSEFSSTVGGNHLIIGDWSHLFLGSWGGVELETDTATKFASGGVNIRAITDIDVGIATPEAFTGFKNLVV